MTPVLDTTVIESTSWRGKTSGETLRRVTLLRSPSFTPAPGWGGARVAYSYPEGSESDDGVLPVEDFTRAFEPTEGVRSSRSSSSTSTTSASG